MTVLAQFSQRADMAAERHRAAALDGRHHDQLVEADVPGIGYAPGRPVIAENICNLQLWAGAGPGPAMPTAGFRLFLGVLRGCDNRSSGFSKGPRVAPHRRLRRGDASRLCPFSQDVDLFGYGESVVDLNAEIAHCALNSIADQHLR
jgi:hypothetical protein